MKSFIVNIWRKIKQNGKYIWVGIAVYSTHLFIEGILVNILWFKVLTPLYVAYI